MTVFKISSTHTELKLFRENVSCRDLAKISVVPAAISVVIFLTSFGLLNGDDGFQQRGFTMIESLKLPFANLRTEKIYGFEMAKVRTIIFGLGNAPAFRASTASCPKLHYAV